jgi:hypothetical protein
MNRLLSLCLTVFLTASAAMRATAGEYIICSGGPALRYWEEYRVKPDRHDNYWANFITAGINRMKGLRQESPNAQITWMIFRPGYVTRAQEDARKPHLPLKFRTTFGQIEGPAQELGARLVYFNSTAEFCGYLNNRAAGKISGFEYFGHSNSQAFLFDYSNIILGCSQSYLHSNQLSRALKRGIFEDGAFVKSWGCNTGDYMSAVWKKATGHALIGACKTMGGNGKTNYAPIADGISLPVVSGSWSE